MSNCNCHTEINRDGSGQLSRYLKALDPSYVNIDDRSIGDLLVFAKRYAAQIRFYDIPGSDIDPNEDKTKVSWREFFRRDMAVVIASIGVIDAKQIKLNYEELRLKIDQRPDGSLFAELFSPIIGMAARIDKWYSLAIPENPLYTDLDLAIASNLKQQVRKMRAYEKGFLSVDPHSPLNLDYSAIVDRELWELDDHVNADNSIYEGATTEDKIRYGALYVDDIFNSFYGFLTHLIDISDSYLQYALEQYPAHQPHMALFISFLRLFKEAQNQMNGLTERMLNFYYRDVLQLTEKPSVPDRAYIVFELAKDVFAYDVAEGTALKGGKDASGKEQVYKTNTELVVNEAKVKELKTIFIDKTPGASPVIQAIYARPIAKSADGFGEKFTDPTGKWPTFGKGTPRPGDIKNICQAIDQYTELANRKDLAQIGFAIASPQLVLQGGNRLIKCRMQGFNELIKENSISILFTGEEGWMSIDRQDEAVLNILDDGEFSKEIILEKSYFFDKEETLYIYLPVAEKGIVPFNAEVHKEYSFATSYPVMQIMAGPGITTDADKFNKLRCDKFSIEVQVGSINPLKDTNTDLFTDGNPNMDGLTTLNIHNDDGPVAIDKPFDPFTAFPQQGSSFSIGSDEIFNKPVDQLTINIELVTSVDNKNQMVVFMRRAQILQGLFGINVAARGRRVDLFRKDNSNLSFTLGEMTQNVLLERNKNLLEERLPILYNEELTNKTYKGFITIKALLAVQNIDNANKNLFEIMQELARLLKIRKVSLSYHSVLDNLDASTDQFFHVYPFGVVETYLGANAREIDLGGISRSVLRTAPRRPSSFINKPGFQDLDKAKEYLLVEAKQKLLPQFTYESPYSRFNDNSINVPKYRRLLNNANIDWKDQIVPRMIEASGLKEKTEGDLSQYSGNLQEEGILFIGLEKLKPLQTISLLFQFAEGSAEDEDNDPPPIHWSYLVNNEWRPLKDENIISDGTEGFRATGIIKIDTPADASDHNTLITDGLIWFCASVTEYSNRIPMLIDVVAQAVEVKFEDNGNAQSHFDTALKAGSISKLSVAVAEIEKVNQPFASFDGKHKEIGKEFYTRVSERLRHKGRAITAWDYEHLILDRFPGIYKVKCITHTDPNCFCRHPLEITPTVEVKECEIEKADIRFLGSTNLPVESQAILKRIAALLFENAHCKLSIIYVDNDISHELNKKRLEFIAGILKVSADRIVTTTKGTGDESIFTMEGIKNAPTVPEEKCCGPQVAPGHVLIIPIADLKNRNAVNPLQPKTSRRTILEIENYIKTRTSPFVKVHVRNPLYEQVLVYFKVKFFPGVDKGFHLKKLNEEIVHYLTPWAFDANAEVKFGQKVYASSVINFIEERPYVDFITDFLMFVCRDECCAPPAPPADPVVEKLLARMRVGIELDATGVPVKLDGMIKNTKTNEPIANVSVSIKDTSKQTTTIADGSFSFDLKGEKLILALSMNGFAAVEATIGVGGSFDLEFEPVQEIVVAGYGSPGIEPKKLNKGCGCSDIEYVLQSSPAFEGETVAEPATPRSILVSVPQHIIIPFEEPDRPSPCDERKKKRTQLAAEPLIQLTGPKKELSNRKSKRKTKKTKDK